MGSCLALVLINAMEERARRAKVVRRAIVERLHYAPFRRDRVRGGKGVLVPNSGAVEVVECLAVVAAGRRRASRAAAAVAVHLPIPPRAEMW